VADQTSGSIDIAAPPIIGMCRRGAEQAITDGALAGLERRVEG